MIVINEDLLAFKGVTYIMIYLYLGLNRRADNIIAIKDK